MIVLQKMARGTMKSKSSSTILQVFGSYYSTSNCRKPLPVLMLFTKSTGCSLCDEAKDVIRPFMDRVNFQETFIDRPENRKWFEKYKFDIPVFHLNGEFLMKHKVNIEKLKKKLSEAEASEKTE